jgi:hypothetical protein
LVVVPVKLLYTHCNSGEDSSSCCLVKCSAAQKVGAMRYLEGLAAGVAAHWMLHSLQKALLHWSRKLETCGAFQ